MAYDVLGAQTRKPGDDSSISLYESDGTRWEIAANAAGDSLILTRGGVTIATFSSSGSTGAVRKVVSKAADYTVLTTDSGTLFTATAAANFTLPTAVGNTGMNFEFFNAADSNMTVTSTPADSMITFNDAAADSVAFSTASEKIGGSIRVTSDGTKWLVQTFLAAETQTPTIAT